MAYFDDEMVCYVPPGDADALAGAILDLGRDPNRRRALAARAQSFSVTHRWSEEARRYVELVERVATGEVHARGT
jgi:glycosyltransferase involved in cell wall biosynthesis